MAFQRAGSRGAARLAVRCRFARSLQPGQSVSVSGVCLTVTRRAGGTVYFDVVAETLRCTTLGALKAGDAVNVERPLKYGRRVGGHFVLGHVDGVGRVRAVRRRGASRDVLIAAPRRLIRFCVEKGSVAVDGTSLTIGQRTASGFWVHLIPHTLKRCIASTYQMGCPVNLEADFLAKLSRRR